MYYKLGRAGKALDRFGVIDFATTHRPRRTRRAAHRQGLRGGAAPAPLRQGPPPRRHHVRRRGARRAADRAHLPVPRRQLRARRARQGRADQVAGRQGDGAAALAPHRRPPGHDARGDARAGDGRRHRRAARRRAPGGRRHRQPGPPPRPRRRRTWPRCATATVDRDGHRLRPRPRQGRRRRRARRVADRRGPRPRRTPPARGRAARHRGPTSTCPTYELPRLAAGIDRGALLELAAAAQRSRGWHERPRDAQPHRRPRRRRPARRPRHRIIVCCGSGGVGKTTDVGGAGAAGGRARTQGRACSPSTRPAGWRSPWASRSWTTPRARCRAVEGRRRHGRLARRDDARHEAHLRRGGGEPVQPGEGQADPGEPVLRRAVQLVRGHPGVHGDGEARPAPQPGAPRTAPTT